MTCLFVEEVIQTTFSYKVLGEIQNTNSRQCLDTMGRKEGENVGIYLCHGQGGNQVCQTFGSTESLTLFRFFRTHSIRRSVSMICAWTWPNQGVRCKWSSVIIKRAISYGSSTTRSVLTLDLKLTFSFRLQTFQLIHPSSKQCIGKNLAPSKPEVRSLFVCQKLTTFNFSRAWPSAMRVMKINGGISRIRRWVLWIKQNTATHFTQV